MNVICSHTKPLDLENGIIFGILLCIATCAATFCNILVLTIFIKMWKKSASNHILLSLAIADVLVSVILGPITVLQLFDVEISKECTANFIRGYFLIFLVGSSLLTLALVSYDRYLLLTKLSNYNKYMTINKAIFLIVFSWVFPGLIPITKRIYVFYSILCIIMYTFPLIALVTFYLLITREVRKREKDLFFKKYNSSKKYCPAELNIHSDAEGVRHPNAESFRKHFTHLKLAKSITVLIACYFACIFPLNIWMFLELVKVEYSKYSSNIFYLCSLLLMQVNSCINPVIYFSKQKEFKKKFKNIFKRRTSATPPLD
ncbi:alpha-1A adrenergic receptor [Hydra vulgaris]|uniref:alpha-1A adrenergic receptor n=1 Tax=Hydra vulgaris TaxID=6087 RepID=UPI001F5F4B64|nr:alpha-1A adrenergic receptor-like [Hydra vulgaris]